MNEQDPKPHCTRCGRKIKPRWKMVDEGVFHITKQSEVAFQNVELVHKGPQYIGPTCRRKWIEDGTHSESDFVDTKPKKEKNGTPK